MSKGIKIALSIVLVCVIGVSGYFGYKIIRGRNYVEPVKNEIHDERSYDFDGGNTVPIFSENVTAPISENQISSNEVSTLSNIGVENMPTPDDEVKIVNEIPDFSENVTAPISENQISSNGVSTASNIGVEDMTAPDDEADIINKINPENAVNSNNNSNNSNNAPVESSNNEKYGPNNAPANTYIIGLGGVKVFNSNYAGLKPGDPGFDMETFQGNFEAFGWTWQIGTDSYEPWDGKSVNEGMFKDGDAQPFETWEEATRPSGVHVGG